MKSSGTIAPENIEEKTVDLSDIDVINTYSYEPRLRDKSMRLRFLSKRMISSRGTRGYEPIKDLSELENAEGCRKNSEGFIEHNGMILAKMPMKQVLAQRKKQHVLNKYLASGTTQGIKDMAEGVGVKIEDKVEINSTL